MRKEIKNKNIIFYDDTDKELMRMGYVGADFVWSFSTNDTIRIGETNDLYKGLEYIMKQDYDFNSEELKCFKDDKKLIWYSDCAYNPNKPDELKSISYLTVEKDEESFKISCTKPIDRIIKRTNSFHAIGFGPLGNGRYARNSDNGKNFQDEIVDHLYLNLINPKYDSIKNDIKFKFHLGVVVTYAKTEYKEKLFNYYTKVYTNEETKELRNIEYLSTLILILETQEETNKKLTKVNNFLISDLDDNKLSLAVDFVRKYILKGEKIDTILFTDILDEKELILKI